MRTTKIINFFRISTFIFALAFVQMPTIAFAQTAAPGSTPSSDSSSGTSANVHDYLNQAQQNEKDRIESSKGKDTGDNYTGLNAAGDAIYDAAKDVVDTATESAAETGGVSPGIPLGTEGEPGGPSLSPGRISSGPRNGGGVPHGGGTALTMFQHDLPLLFRLL